jgi:DNA-binding response OmpR family regulator
MSKRILIAEDDVHIRELLTMQAKMRGYEVTAVNDSLEYLVAVSKTDFDLILTDIMMPDLNGASATEIMKLQGCAVPVIALTALTPEDIRLVKNKFDRVFHKPIDLADMFKHIEILLSK